MALAPEVAVRRALAVYLRTALSLSASACQPDWFPATQALPRPVAVSIHEAGPVEHEDELPAPAPLTITPGAGATAAALYRLGALRVPLAIEVWGSTAKERDDLVERLARALDRPPTVGGERVVAAMGGLSLACTSEDYFGAIVTYDCESRTALPTPEGIAREEWRAVFQVTARVDELREESITRQTAMTTDLAVGPAVDPAGSGAAETRTIFTGG